MKLQYRKFNDTVHKILFWKFNLVKYSNKVINYYNILLFHVHSDASNTGIPCVFDVRGKKIFFTEISLI